MKIFWFDKLFPYSAIIVAESAEQAIELYFSEVCEPDDNDDWSSELPEEITRDAALANMVDTSKDLDSITSAEYLDRAIAEGVPQVVGVDSSLL